MRTSPANGWLNRWFGSKPASTSAPGAAPSLAAVPPETVTHVDESGRGVDSITDTDIRRAVTLFTRQHQTITGPWLMFHLTRGDNPWAVRSQAGKYQQLAFNPEYRLDDDEAESAEGSAS